MTFIVLQCSCIFISQTRTVPIAEKASNDKVLRVLRLDRFLPGFFNLFGFYKVREPHKILTKAAALFPMKHISIIEIAF